MKNRLLIFSLLVMLSFALSACSDSGYVSSGAVEQISEEEVISQITSYNQYDFFTMILVFWSPDLLYFPLCLLNWLR